MTTDANTDATTIRFYSNKGATWLSNFSYAPFDLDGFHWLYVESYYQAQKFPDYPEYQEIIRNLVFPFKAKQLGGKKSLYPLRTDWDYIKEDVMRKALFAKFDQNPKLKQWLLDTKQHVLVEDSPYDSYWGCGRDGTGKNRLGVLLMELRDQYQLTQRKRPHVWMP